jgi:hypothetical protein
MAEAMIVHRNGSIFLFSWPRGFKKANPPNKHTDDTVLAKAMWLERHGRSDEADELIERWTSAKHNY